MLREVKKVLLEKKKITLSDLSLQFHKDKNFMESIMEFFIHKNKIKKITCSGCKSCKTCLLNKEIIYEWIFD